MRASPSPCVQFLITGPIGQEGMKMSVIIITEREQKLAARMEGLRAFLSHLRTTGDISHFLTLGDEIRIWINDSVGQPADLTIQVTTMSLFVVSGPCRVFVGNGKWSLPRYGFQKPLPSTRHMMKSFCDSLATIF